MELNKVKIGLANLKRSVSSGDVKKLALISILALVSSGCNKGSSSGSSASVAACVASSDPRMQICNQTLALDSSSSSSVLSEGSLTLTLVASVTPPVSAGTSLQASDIFVNGTSAYVSYNLSGNTVAGAIDLIDTTVQILPVLKSDVTFADTKVNKVYQSGSSVFAVGGTSNGAIGPAVLYGMTQASGVISSTHTTANLTSYAGTAIKGNGTNLFAISGDTGGLQMFNQSTLAAGTTYSISDARDVAIAPSGLAYVVAGQPGRIFEFSSTGVYNRTISLGGASIAQSKSTIIAGNNNLLATIGDGGTDIVCTQNGQVLANIPAPTNVGTLPSTSTVSNAAASGPGVIFVANGEAGVYVYQATTGAAIAGTSCNAVSTAFLGTINFGTHISANNVYYAGGSLFVATGTGGFKIVNVALTVPLFGLTL